MTNNGFNLPLDSSPRSGGLNCDGAVKFITDPIEVGTQTNGVVQNGQAGNSAPGSKSPYGLWGALGTRASKEVIDSAF